MTAQPTEDPSDPLVILRDLPEREREEFLRQYHMAVDGEAPVMAGPGDEMAARTGDGGRLRASHADREQVIGTLKAAFVQGLLDKDEFGLRVGQAFESRTYAELAAVTAGIPAGLAAAQPPEPARAQDQQPVLRPGPVMMAATVFCAGVWPDHGRRAGLGHSEAPGR